MRPPSDTATGFLTLGECARRLGVPLWKVQSLLDRGLGPKPGRVGHYRVFTEAQLPALADALAAAGCRPALQGVSTPAIQASGAGGNP